ncbi:MAG: FMN-binding glutamate synthase family protein, partial [Dehalococcoidia bacterium]
MKTFRPPQFIVERDLDRCITCKVCSNQCTFDSHIYDSEADEMVIRPGNCVGCHR